MSGTVSTATKTCRLLYYGPAGSGKRENLQLIHQSIPPEFRLSLASEDPERQIAFRLRQQDEWQVLVQCVDAGRERYRTAGTAGGPPFDGIVFVVNSGAAHLDESLASFEALKTYLDTWELDLMGVPIVIQYNRREDPQALAVDRLEALLNPWGLLSFPSSSAQGEGVRETLKAILGLTVNHINEAEARQMGQPSQPGPAPTPQNQTHAVPGGETSSLDLEYGPPIPGTEIAASTRARGEAIFDELRPPVVIPVKIPHRLLETGGPVRILLEVEIDDSEAI